MKAGEHIDTLVTRTRRLALAGAAALLVVLGGYWYHQVLNASFYRQLAENNRLRQNTLLAPRGLILDRKGRPLVENVPSYNLLLDRSRSEDIETSLGFAAAVLERSSEELETLLERYRTTPRFVPVLMAEDLGLKQVARFEVAGLEHPEFEVSVSHLRLYRHGVQAAHLLGYLGEASVVDVDSRPDVQAGEFVGREGVEQAFDERLRGEDGEQIVVVDSRGKLVEEYRRQPARPGESISLTIDLDLQQEAEHLLQGKVGAVVALDPRDGALRALVSSPSYDPNLFVRRLESAQWRAIVDAPGKPLQNRAIHNTYAPGSVFKIVMGLAGLENGTIDPEERVFCGGSARFYERPRRCWKASGHGWVDLHDAIKHSCDIYFYVQGQEMGIEEIASASRLMGLGQHTGIKLPGEREGLVPDGEWSLRRRQTPWYPGETISVSIGQGPILTTPLQLAVVTAAAANGGKRVVPYLVEGRGEPPVDLGISEVALNRVREALRAVVNDQGSGRRAQIPGLVVAGKTGTAQVVEQKTWTRSEDLAPEHRDHSWFASFAPFESPELVVLVFVEHGGLGSQTAAPIARELHEKYFGPDPAT